MQNSLLNLLECLSFHQLLAQESQKDKLLSHPASIRTLGGNELLEVFLELEQLDDKPLREAVVHGRKKLQALADTGTTHIEFLDVTTIEDDTQPLERHLIWEEPHRLTINQL